MRSCAIPTITTPKRPSRSAVLKCSRAMSSLTSPFTKRTTGISCSTMNRSTALHVLAADPAQHRRRGNRKAAIEQKPDHLKLGLQPRHVPLKEQPVDRPDLERHVIGE